MKLFNSMKLVFENHRLEGEVERLETILSATEGNLMDRVQEYRELLGEREILRERIELLDTRLYQANKILDEIIEVAENNDYGNNKNKIKKILDLAKFETTTKPSK